MATYDPFSGLLLAPNGGQMILGSTGGQQRVFGKDSWEWLLLAPLSG